jgi:anti-sigma regulatory factor (Ser/Thr protein kinase)
MRLDQAGSANGDRPSLNGSGPRLELETLQATCRRQAVVIDRLSEVVSNLHRGAKALKAENSELRGENERLADDARFRSRARGRMDDGDLVEMSIALGVQAPGAARTVVAQCLDERVAASALENARLVMSELVANSLQHCGGQVGDRVVVSVELMPDWFRVGVQDSGSDAVIAARPASVDTGNGFGLNLVHLLSERWGVERLAKGGTRVWAQLPRAPLPGVGTPGSGQLATRAA